ncbi:Uncharacterised protein [Mycobacteroides abscessus subsp. abscessus]|uniref:hypothetical protein n=1 Tax=Mycobacteroides abscessus TaxID=36809 RepID=UPI0009262AC9|nr:hypothetical protein [Mycobacteroides abscessus]SIH25658.1 Uncharacterised protein [Mycobacteroides abscessus subsp. abscessus]
MRLFKRSVSSPFGAGILAAAIAGLLLTLMTLAVTYMIGGADAVAGGTSGFWGTLFVAPVHTAMLQVIRGGLVVAAGIGILVGGAVTVVQHESAGAR